LRLLAPRGLARKIRRPSLKITLASGLFSFDFIRRLLARIMHHVPENCAKCVQQKGVNRAPFVVLYGR
jgi:hypothetical protein